GRCSEPTGTRSRRPRRAEPSPDDPARQAGARVPRGLAPVVVRVLVDDDGQAGHVLGAETAGEEGHLSPPVVGEQDGKVACVVTVGLAVRVVVPSRRGEGLVGVAHLASPLLVEVEAQRARGWGPWSVTRQALDPD